MQALTLGEFRGGPSRLLQVYSLPSLETMPATYVSRDNRWYLNQTSRESQEKNPRICNRSVTGGRGAIIVACPLPDGSIMLAARPVLSYCEFKHLMSDRLTDEAWRDLLDSPNKPGRPTWYRSLMP